MDTGADVRFVHLLDHYSDLVWQAGATVGRSGPDGPAWRRDDLGVDQVVAVLERVGCLLVVSSGSGLALLGLADGATRWEFREPGGREYVGAGSVRVVDTTPGATLVCCANYATAIDCFDLFDLGQVRHRWRHDLADRIDAGFGPVLTFGLDAAGSPASVLVSSRTGTSYCPDGCDVVSERLVLGRDDGRIYQCALDLESGAVLDSLALVADPSSGYPAARPYGLLQAVGRPSSALVLISCQVEEYVAVTGLSPMIRQWGWFVEKDWPDDRQELRPQPTSVARTHPDGRPRLVVGHWSGGEWTTLVADVLPGGSGEIERLAGYFWGAFDFDGDGLDELLMSDEPARRTRGVTRLFAHSVTRGEVLGSIDEVELVVCRDPELPIEAVIHAGVHTASTITDGAGRIGVVVHRGGEVAWWHPGSGAVLTLVSARVARVDARHGRAALTEACGRVWLLDESLRTTGSVALDGRTCQPLLADRDHRQVLVMPLAGSRLRVTMGNRVWEVPGDHAALHDDEHGQLWLASVVTGGTHSTITVRRVDEEEPTTRTEWERPGSVDQLMLAAPAPGSGLVLVVVTRGGPHTSAVTAFDLDGRTLWADAARGVHASEPLAFASGGRWRMASDDHGVLTVRDLVTGEEQLTADWTAAYTTPILAELGGEPVLLRADGSHGVGAINGHGSELWRRTYRLFEVFPGNSVLCGPEEQPLVAVPRRGGPVDLLGLIDGQLEGRIEVGPQAARRPLLSLGPVLIGGTIAGELLAWEVDSQRLLWRLDFDSAVESLAAVAGESSVTLAVGTSDGRVRLVELGGPRQATEDPMR